MDFYSKIYDRFAMRPTSGVKPSFCAPKHESLAEHKRHCGAKPGNCPFEKRASKKAESEDFYSFLLPDETKEPLVRPEREYRVTPDGRTVPANPAFRNALSRLDAEHRIYAVSDIHSSRLGDLDIDGCGIVVIGGDFMQRAYELRGSRAAVYGQFGGTGSQGADEAWLNGTFIPWIESHWDKQFVIIPGNHDKFFERRDAEKRIKWPPNVHFVIDKPVVVNGLKIYGTPWCLHNLDGAFEVGHGQLAQKFEKIPEDLDILVAHTPPKVEGSDVDFGAEHYGHFGSPELTDAILSKKPRLVICGHVHTGDHRPFKLGGTTVVNVSHVGGRRDAAGFAGRMMGFFKPSRGHARFLIDCDDGQQIDMSAYPEAGSKVMSLRLRRDGEIAWSLAFGILRRAAVAVNEAIDAGHRHPQENAIGEFNFAKRHILALPDRDEYSRKLKQWAEKLDTVIQDGCRERAPDVEPPPKPKKTTPLSTLFPWTYGGEKIWFDDPDDFGFRDMKAGGWNWGDYWKSREKED